MAQVFDQVPTDKQTSLSLPKICYHLITSFEHLACSLFLSDAPRRWLYLYLFVILFAWVVQPLNCWSLDQLYQPIWLNASLTWCLLDRTFIFDLFSLLLSWNWNFSSLCWHRDVSALSENFNFYLIILKVVLTPCTAFLFVHGWTKYGLLVFLMIKIRCQAVSKTSVVLP